MNNQRRKRLSEINEMIAEIKSDLEEARDLEQDAFEMIPESLQYSSNGEKMTEAIDNLDNSISSIEDAESSIVEAMA